MDDDGIEDNEEVDKNRENSLTSATIYCIKIDEDVACKNCIVCCFFSSLFFKNTIYIKIPIINLL